MADKPAQKPTPSAAETARRVATSNTGLFGRAARALRDRGSQIDSAVDDAELGRARARQHHDYE